MYESTRDINGIVAGGPACRIGERAVGRERGNIAAGFDGRPGFCALKRVFDIVLSAAILVALSPLLLLIALVIWIDDPKGSPLFRQERVGKRGRRFRMLKFRTMCIDAEDRLAELRCANEKDGPVFKIENDPRVTRVGHFLRKTSLDELPQFWNVLKGDMSVVGPRPALPNEVERYTERDRLRLAVQPGITCFWQARRNRDAIPFDEWVELDLRYIQTASIGTDIALVVKTVGCVLGAQGQ